jgi:hypothetical protein
VQARGLPWCQASSRPQKVGFALDSVLEGTEFELSVPRESLAEDRDDGLLFRSRWRKMSVEERSDSAVCYRARTSLYGRRPYRPPGGSKCRRYRPSRASSDFPGLIRASLGSDVVSARNASQRPGEWIYFEHGRPEGR